jgi:hypothetical protein
MKSKDELSPMDSWISFAPGAGVALNKRIQEMWIETARDLRKFRGDILAACFEVENVLDEIVGEVFFPGLFRAPGDSTGTGDPVAYSNSAVLKNAFGRIFLRASGGTLGRKVRLFKDISKEIRQMGDLLTDQLETDLDKVLNLRNAFAHFPITFEVRGGQAGPEFAALILIGGEIVELAQPACQRYKALVSSTAGLLRSALVKLQANPDRGGESPLSKNGIVWLGHAALGDDAWQVENPELPLNMKDFWLRGSRPDLKVNVHWSDCESNRNGKGG